MAVEMDGTSRNRKTNHAFPM